VISSGTARCAVSLLAAVAVVSSGSVLASDSTSAHSPPPRQVVVVSIDGLNPEAITRLGREGTPHLHRMMRQGASTLNARTAVEQTETLPNHTGMATGRRIEAASGGHGVTWNDERLTPATVQQAAGEGVDSIFAAAHRAGLESALYSAKVKFSLFDRSWPAGTTKSVIDERNRAVARAARTDLAAGRFDFTFLHLSPPDVAGHEHGWMSPEYLEAVRLSDQLVGSVLRTIRADPALEQRTTVILTADHGGPVNGLRHRDASLLANYRIPFLMWGRGVTRGADLYELSPSLVDPGDARVGYDGPQPVRNGFVANAAAELLGLPAVRESELNAESELNWGPSS
jgi:predicted AlkP superfamily pyrophosphatase or phosphodiesterase